jgi:hypothetical protein
MQKLSRLITKMTTKIGISKSFNEIVEKGGITSLLAGPEMGRLYLYKET